MENSPSRGPESELPPTPLSLAAVRPGSDHFPFLTTVSLSDALHDSMDPVFEIETQV